MTLNDALRLWGEYTQDVLKSTSYNYDETMNILTAQGFIGWAYGNNYEIVDRTMSDEEIEKQMDETDAYIADSLKFVDDWHKGDV